MEENQSRLQKILQFWASKELYDQDTIHGIENEMMRGLPMNSFPGPRDLRTLSPDPSASTGSFPNPCAGYYKKFVHMKENELMCKDEDFGSTDSIHLSKTKFVINDFECSLILLLCVRAGVQHQAANQNAWQPDKQSHFPNLPDQEYRDKLGTPMQPSLAPQQFLPASAPPTGFAGSAAIPLSVQPASQLPAATTKVGEKLPPYPLFPPGLIPGMVRKMQIGSGVPYSPMSPLDIPTVIPPSNVSPSEILERVSKFFREIGEVNPSEGPMKSSELRDDYDDYERESPIRKGGACIPPPPDLHVDPESGTYPDGSVERKPGSSDSGRLGLGATADPNEASQYDDVYTSYRKQRSTNYHSSMSARAASR